MTRAIVLHEPGGPERLHWQAIDVPAPSPGQLLIRHTAIGVNFHDTYVRSGLYRTLPLPGIPGLEAAAVVEVVGPGVSGFSVGDRIVYIDKSYGAYSERRVLPADLALRIPESFSDEAAAALTLKAMTVCMLVQYVHNVGAGTTILVHAGAGGVGQPLVRWAKHLGATVIATAGSAEKGAVARACGADHVVLYRQESFPDRVREITGGRGVDVVYDSVGKDTFVGSLECLGTLGHLVAFGQSSGAVAPINVQSLAAKSNSLTRPMLFHYIQTRAALERTMEAVLGVVGSGVIPCEIGLRVPLKDATAAHRALEARTTTGSTILIP